MRGGVCGSVLARVFSSTLLTIWEVGFAGGLCRSFSLSTLSGGRIFITITPVQLWNSCPHGSSISLPRPKSKQLVAIRLGFPKLSSRLINKVFFSRCFFSERDLELIYTVVWYFWIILLELSVNSECRACHGAWLISVSIWLLNQLNTIFVMMGKFYDFGKI